MHVTESCHPINPMERNQGGIYLSAEEFNDDRTLQFISPRQLTFNLSLATDQAPLHPELRYLPSTTTTGGTFLAWCFNINQGIPTYNLPLSLSFYVSPYPEGRGADPSHIAHASWDNYTRKMCDTEVEELTGNVCLSPSSQPHVLQSVSVWMLAVSDASSSCCSSRRIQ